MTKTEAIKTAKRARQYGHFARGYCGISNAQLVEVACPNCREAVTGYHTPYDKTANTAAKALDKAMISHLLDECEAQR